MKVSPRCHRQTSGAPGAIGQPPRLLDQVRARMRRLGMAGRAEDAYVSRICRFNVSQGRRPPRELGAPEAEAFLTDLAVWRFNSHIP